MVMRKVTTCTITSGRLLTGLVVDNDAGYVVASRIRRHEDRPGTATLAGLVDTY